MRIIANELIETGRKFDSVIIGNKTLDETTQDVREAICEYNDKSPKLFRFNKCFCRIAVDDNGFTYVQILDTVPLLTNELMNVCSWLKYDGKSNSAYKTDPPRKVIENLMSCPEYNIISPTLIGITDIPIIDQEGNILEKKGYDPATRLYYTGEIKLTVPENPTDEQIKEARELLEEPFVDFPFINDGNVSRVNLMAALITAVIRPHIMGNIPIFAITKQTVGVGASLITDVISIISTGSEAKNIPWSEDEEEIRKKISTSLKFGSKLIVFDNIKSKQISSSALASLVTSAIWKDRDLGALKSIEIANTSMVIMNGIGLAFSSDLTRRVVTSTLESDSATPWKDKKNYKHADLRMWAHLYRNRIIEAVYTLLRAWIRRGRPRLQLLDQPLGNFEQWSETVGGVLGIAGHTNLMRNIDDVMIDVETEQWKNFVEALYETYKDKPFSVSQLQRLLTDEEKCGGDIGLVLHTLPDDLSDAFYGRKNFTKVCGFSFRYYNNRNLGANHKLIKGGISHHTTLWKIADVHEQRRL